MKRSFLIAAAALLCAVLSVATVERVQAAPNITTAAQVDQGAATDFSAKRKKNLRRHRAARVRSYAVSPECNVSMPCIGVGPTAFGRQFERENIMGKARLRYTPQAAVELRTRSTAGLVAPLASKLASIQSVCPGTVAVSGVRHTRIAGTRRMSLHAEGKAVDVQGPYNCIYVELRGWSGGYSTDAGRMRHVHISYDSSGGREMGLRFAHGGHRKYAPHRRPNYASAYPH